VFTHIIREIAETARDLFLIKKSNCYNLYNLFSWKRTLASFLNVIVDVHNVDNRKCFTTLKQQRNEVELNYQPGVEKIAEVNSRLSYRDWIKKKIL
jgi:hypothetical protein